MKNLTQKEKDLLKKFESNKNNNNNRKPSKEDYVKHTDRNYKDGDRN